MEEKAMNDSKSIMQQYVDSISGHNIERVRQLLHPKYSYIGSDGKKQEGIQAGIDITAMYLNAFPDLRLSIKNIYTAGDVVVTEFVARGTHRGNLMDIQPTNKKIEVSICDVVEVRDGKIFAEREYFDAANMLQQLGVTSIKGQA